MTQKSYIAIVNPFVSLERLPKVLKRYNIECIAIIEDQRTTCRLGDIVHYDSSLFAENIRVSDGYEKMLATLRSLNVIAILSGIEMVTEFTDELNETLKLPFSNPLESSLERFDKYATCNQLRACGIPVAKQMRVSSQDIHENKINLDGFPTPIVVKPIQSAASFGVHICETKEIAIDMLRLLAQKEDEFLNIIHDDFIIAEMLTGREYVIDLINFDAKQFVSGVYVHEKIIIEGKPIGLSFSWVDPDSIEAQQLIDYVKQVMKAVDFYYGAAHVEVFLTEEGPRLVEINPRFSGSKSFFNKLAKLMTGADQSDILAALYAKNTDFELYKKPKSSAQYAMTARLCNFSQPARINQRAVDKIISLPSYQEHFIYQRDIHPVTENLHSQVGLVLLHNESKEQLEQDYQRLLAIQKTELFGAGG